MNTSALRKSFRTDGLVFKSKSGSVLSGKDRARKLDALYDNPDYGIAVLQAQIAANTSPVLRQVERGADGKRDAQNVPIFAQQLEHVYAKTYEALHSELPAANGDVIPIDTSPDEGDETFVWYTYDSTGVAKFMDAYNAADMPEGEEFGTVNSGVIKTALEGYGWTTDDVRRARKANYQLEARKGRRARYGHDLLLHNTILWGDSARKLRGLFNHPNISGGVGAASGTGSSTLWADKTAAQIIIDIAAAINVGIRQTTNRLHAATDCLMATPLYDAISIRLMTEGQNGTILEQVERIWKNVTFTPMEELVPAQSQGNLTSQAIFAYQKSEDTAEAVVPMPFTQHAPQQRGLTFTVPTESRIGGVKMIRPLAFFMLEGLG